MSDSIFDEWTDVKSVNCNDCDSYWTNQCDGVSEGKERTCKAYKATRRVVLPAQIKRLQKSIKWLSYAMVILAALLIGVAIALIVVANAKPKEEVIPSETATSVIHTESMEELTQDMKIAEVVDPLEGFTSIGSCKISHYCICEKCCGKSEDNPAYGITRSGVKATPGVTVAVDPSIIPLGSEVIIDYGDGELHYMKAEDTGSAIKGDHLDICVSDHQEALNLGIKTATVYYKTSE